MENGKCEGPLLGAIRVFGVPIRQAQGRPQTRRLGFWNGLSAIFHLPCFAWE